MSSWSYVDQDDTTPPICLTSINFLSKLISGIHVGLVTQDLERLLLTYKQPGVWGMHSVHYSSMLLKWPLDMKPHDAGNHHCIRGITPHLLLSRGGDLLTLVPYEPST